MNDFPSLKDELRPRLKSTPKTIITDDEVEANSQTMGQRWGATTSLDTTPKTETSRAPVVSVRGYIPEYLDAELALKAAERRVTKTFLIVEALQKSGYRVDPADLIEDRRKR